MMVRQLPSGPQGLGLELYCFSTDLDWVRYEGIQSDLFDHLLVALREFDLQVFQEPSGQDLRALRVSP
jgi:miniconductance mechanosensitive channel